MKKILKIAIFILFIVLSLILGYYHEPWADEAQAWLIARDASVPEIIFSISRYEGSPSLWQLILKVLIVFGFPYKYYFLIPVFFTSIGIYIILFKLEISDGIKLLLPFTYFIAFEYGIKARNYCLLLPILSMIAYLYSKRREHTYLYNFFVLILAFVSLHGAIISGVLWIFEIMEILKQIGEKDGLKNYKKEIISTIIISISYMFIIISLIPTGDVYVNITADSLKVYSFFNKCIYYGITLLEAFCLKDEYYKIMGIPTLIIVLGMFYCILKSNKYKAKFILLFVLELAFIFIVRVTEHHIGLIFLLFLFATYLVKDGIDDKNKKMLRILLTIVLCVQVFWYAKTYVADIKMDFSAGKATAEYLSSLDYKNKNIYGTGYYLTAILPYFDENIFDGPRGGKTYYIWGKSNDDWIWSSNHEFLYPDILESNPDVVVLQDYYDNAEKYYEEVFGKEMYAYTRLIKMLKNNENYKMTYYRGTIIFKGADGSRDNEGFYVFERIK